MSRKSLLLGLFLATAVHAVDVPPGHVLLRVKDADLATEVLPRIAARAGVKIECEVATPKKVTLLLNQPIPWEQALDLACQFARTHPVRTSQGRIVVRAKFGGQLGSAAGFKDLHGKTDPEQVEALRERTAQVASAQAREAAPWNAYLRRRWGEFMAEMDRKFSLGPNSGFVWTGGNLRGEIAQGVVPRGPDGPTGVVPVGSNHQADRQPAVIPRGPDGPTGSTLQGAIPRGPDGPTGVVPRTDLPRGPDGPSGSTLTRQPLTNGRAGQR